MFIATSIDGFIAGPGGDLSWLPEPSGDSVSDDHGYSAFMADVGAMLMGRNTYDTVVGFGVAWPYTVPVLVASSRTVSPAHESVRGVAGDIAALIEDARATAAGRDVYIDGGAVIRQACDAGLIDEMIISIVPVVLGAGAPLFTGVEQRRRFELVSHVAFADLLQLRYVNSKRS